MPKVFYTDADGVVRAIDGEVGDTVMELAVRNGVPGIVAECGGACVCATCHVYVRADFGDRLPPMDEQEDDMLDGAAAPRRPESRLSCQLTLTAELDGLSVTTPATQL
ncbi:2Fe-2S iron-sulfur cluster-binding protein [Micromonospora radicis]|uniref:(2Fe-2S)-binding protein n=1 Tax=Micromonospora radicis TaxID=1894971 RepID=A0A418MWE9_9ACTN|nr:2Fe-2S iron-sulfur cluster-binding protein [Micromonospora radicis]RIV39211.1 (2Fe-2S)-binding protein [Micromonospora radicis]